MTQPDHRAVNSIKAFIASAQPGGAVAGSVGLVAVIQAQNGLTCVPAELAVAVTLGNRVHFDAVPAEAAVVPAGLLGAVVPTIPGLTHADTVVALSIPGAMNTFRSGKKLVVVDAKGPGAGLRIAQFPVIAVVTVASPELAVAVIAAVLLTHVESEVPEALQVLDFPFESRDRVGPEKAVALGQLVEFLLSGPVLRVADVVYGKAVYVEDVLALGHIDHVVLGGQVSQSELRHICGGA